MDREAFERDRDRDNRLRLLGWTVLRFTWAKLRFEPAEGAANGPGSPRSRQHTLSPDVECALIGAMRH